MNKDLQVRVRELVRILEKVHADQDDIEAELRTDFDQLSAKAQESDKGDALQEKIDAIEAAGDSLQAAIDSFTEALDK